MQQLHLHQAENTVHRQWSCQAEGQLCIQHISWGISDSLNKGALLPGHDVFPRVPTVTSTSEFPNGRGLALPITSFGQGLFSTTPPTDIVKGASISQRAPGQDLAQGNEDLGHGCQ